MTPNIPESKPAVSENQQDTAPTIDKRPDPLPTLNAEAGTLLANTLSVLFPKDARQRAWLAGFPSIHQADWRGAEYRQWTPGGLASMKDWNCYVCNGTYKAGTKRANENVEAIHFFVFDDIGTKVSFSRVQQAFRDGGVIPALEVETSPGNETWLVAAKGIDTPEQIERYKALQRALGRHGLTDTAMRDATRYTRLPFGVNDKKGKPVPVRALAVRKTSPWTIIELASALGIDLDKEIANEPKTNSGRTSQAQLEHGTDPYVNALEELGLVKGGKTNGWLDITCPWEHEHTVRGASGTGYQPNGGWECHHGHCADRTTEHFKREIRRLLDEKGTKGGAAGFLAAASFTSVEDMPPDEQRRIAERSRTMRAALGGAGDATGGGADESLDDEAVAALLQDTVYVRNSDRYYAISSGTFMNRAAFNETWERALAHLLRTNKQGAIVESPAEFFRRRGAPWNQADAPIYWPGRTVRFRHDGREHLNLWRAPDRARHGRKIELWEIKPWLRLVIDLCNGDRKIIRVFLDQLARIVAVQDWKPGFGTIIKGMQGIGKDQVFSVLGYALGHSNFNTVTPDRIGAKFNVDTEKRAVVVNEMKMTTRGSLTAHDQYNMLKTLVAPYPEWLRVERKGQDVYQIPNRCAWFFNTNEDAPLAMSEDDRRFFVIECKRTTRREASFYEDIGWWLEKLGGRELVSEWLEQRGLALSDERVRFLSGNAPMTDAKRDMIELAPKSGRSYVVELQEWVGERQDEWPELLTTEDVVVLAVNAIKAGTEGLDRDMRLPKARQLGWALAKLGWEKVSGTNPVPMPFEKGGKSRHVWARKDADKYRVSRGELARLYADAHGFQPPKGVVHGSAEGANVVALGSPARGAGKEKPGQDAAPPVPEERRALPGDADWPF